MKVHSATPAVQAKGTVILTLEEVKRVIHALRAYTDMYPRVPQGGLSRLLAKMTALLNAVERTASADFLLNAGEHRTNGRVAAIDLERLTVKIRFFASEVERIADALSISGNRDRRLRAEFARLCDQLLSPEAP